MRHRRKLGTEQRRLLAEFAANMAVAWFAGGVITVVLGNVRGFPQAIFMIIAGFIFGLGFLLYGLYLSRRISL